MEEKASKRYLYDSVAQIEALRNRGNDMLVVTFSAEFVRLLQTANSTEHRVCMRAKIKRT
jgi:hypothetical protein